MRVTRTPARLQSNKCKAFHCNILCSMTQLCVLIYCKQQKSTFFKVKVKCTLVQALRLCTGRTAHRGSRGIALPFLDYGNRCEGQRHALAAFYPQERPGTHCTGGWVGPRAGLDRCGKSHPHRDSNPGPSSP
jgi:hypothetical protein